MSDDLIKREDALHQIWDWVTKREFEYTNATYWLQKRIEAIPSADRPRGEWIEQGISPYEGIRRCSNCESVYDIKEHFIFCPNCGARMKGADDE